eukprot:gene6070-12245_t
MSSKGRLSKRQDDRRRAAFSVFSQSLNHNACSNSTISPSEAIMERRPMSIEEFHQICADICSNNVCKFGIVKLISVDLNDHHECQHPIKECIVSMGLLQYSCLLQRDSITSALLRAGADPTEGKVSHTLSKQIQKHLLQLHPQFSVFILNILYSMLHPVENNPHNHMSSTSSSVYNICNTCSSCGSYISTDENSFVVQYPCGHGACLQCFWSSILPHKYDDIRCCCSTCPFIITDNPVNTSLNNILSSSNTSSSKNVVNADDLSPMSSSSSSSLILNNPSANETTLTTIITTNNNPSEIALISLEKYLQLPITIEELSKEAHKRPPFKARSMTYLNSIFLGSIRSKRVSELLIAAERGCSQRIYYIIAAGVDVNHRNEYGQSAMFLAVWRRHLDAVRLLLRCGADPSLMDNANWSPLSIAMHNQDNDNDKDMVCVLQEALSIDTTDVTTSVTHASIPWYVTDSDMIRTGIVDVLIGAGTGAGAGSYCLDDFFSDSFLSRLSHLFTSLPITPASKVSCSERSYYCDSLRWVQSAIRQALVLADIGCSDILLKMRFLHYPTVGGYLVPHIDLSKTIEEEMEVEVEDKDGNRHGQGHGHVGQRSSTHTFILYLTTCESGGETVLLDRIPSVNRHKKKASSLSHDVDMETMSGSMSVAVPLAVVSPKRGRLLVFPHICPHEGRPTDSGNTPKLLLRGEMY